MSFFTFGFAQTLASISYLYIVCTNIGEEERIIHIFGMIMKHARRCVMFAICVRVREWQLVTENAIRAHFCVGL